MKILIVEPGQNPKTAEIENTLAAKQTVVGGLIEMVCPPNHADDAVILCNEEGKFNGSMPNRMIRLEDGTPYDVIFGTFMICRAPSDTEDFDGLTEDQIKMYVEMYR